MPAVAAAASSGVSEGPSNVSETYQDWVVRCVAESSTPSGKYCEVAQEVRNKDGGQRVLATVITYDKDGKRQATLLMPLGLSLPKGVELFIDDADNSLTKLDYSTCQQAGCLASFEVTEDMFAAFRSGRAIRVRVFTNEGKPADLPMSLRGFDAAHKRLMELKD